MIIRLKHVKKVHAKGRTVLLVTHDRAQAERYCDRLIVLEDGKVKEDHIVSPRAKTSRVDQLEAEVARLEAELEAVKKG